MRFTVLSCKSLAQAVGCSNSQAQEIFRLHEERGGVPNVFRNLRQAQRLAEQVKGRDCSHAG